MPQKNMKPAAGREKMRLAEIKPQFVL